MNKVINFNNLHECLCQLCLLHKKGTLQNDLCMHPKEISYTTKCRKWPRCTEVERSNGENMWSVHRLRSQIVHCKILEVWPVKSHRYDPEMNNLMAQKTFSCWTELQKAKWFKYGFWSGSTFSSQTVQKYKLDLVKLTYM